MFGFETTPGIYPYPFTTAIPAPNQAGGHITVYYRTHFTYTNRAGFTLYASNYVDDGAVYYINNIEVGRLRMSGTITNGTLAGNSSEPAFDLLTFPTNAIVPGDNVLAVEVHQSATSSSDDVFGMSLAAVSSVTNVISTAIPVVLNEILAN